MKTPRGITEMEHESVLGEEVNETVKNITGLLEELGRGNFPSYVLLQKRSSGLVCYSVSRDPLWFVLQDERVVSLGVKVPGKERCVSVLNEPGPWNQALKDELLKMEAGLQIRLSSVAELARENRKKILASREQILEEARKVFAE